MHNFIGNDLHHGRAGAETKARPKPTDLDTFFLAWGATKRPHAA